MKRFVIEKSWGGDYSVGRYKEGSSFEIKKLFTCSSRKRVLEILQKTYIKGSTVVFKGYGFNINEIDVAHYLKLMRFQFWDTQGGNYVLGNRVILYGIITSVVRDGTKLCDVLVEDYFYIRSF